MREIRGKRNGRRERESRKEGEVKSERGKRVEQ